MIIRFLGQSGYVLKTGSSEIIIDPYLSDSVNRVAGRPRLLPIPINPSGISCNAVICTHDHLDHLDPDTVSLIGDEQLFVTTSGGKEKLKNPDLWAELYDLVEMHKVEFIWVKGHAGHPYNERCDVLATTFADSFPEPVIMSEVIE